MATNTENQDITDTLAAALESCVTQIEQMKGMFDDSDGTIQDAIVEADIALSRYRAAAASASLT